MQVFSAHSQDNSGKFHDLPHLPPKPLGAQMFAPGFLEIHVSWVQEDRAKEGNTGPQGLKTILGGITALA